MLPFLFARQPRVMGRFPAYRAFPHIPDTPSNTHRHAPTSDPSGQLATVGRLPFIIYYVKFFFFIKREMQLKV